eukprot:TRINITY_DN62727_c0_g1_i1.p2 TRINITY_DN62727_c0_g1~~TRINITY_DN62727_c0_g1_i1.p2  ORF type:complete len:102 (-),score=23.25 TRINITY_DN62727_c0_g1_i1:183-488(-)
MCIRDSINAEYGESRRDLMSRRATRVAPIATPLYQKYWFRFTAVMGSMLTGASVVHNIFKPDVTIPELDEQGNRKDGRPDQGKEFLELWRNSGKEAKPPDR